MAFAIYDDTPRAIPAANPFNPMPEEAWIGEVMQEKRQELLAEGMEPHEVEPVLQLWAHDTLPTYDTRPDPSPPEPLPGEAWRLQPRDDEGQWTKDEHDA